MSDLIQVCGLWMKTSAKGTVYMVGRMAGLRVSIFKNTRKQSDKDPDYNLMVSAAEDKPAEQAQGATNPQGGGYGTQNNANAQRGANGGQQRGNGGYATNPSDDDLPF